jgi:hypothetical protein
MVANAHTTVYDGFWQCHHWKHSKNIHYANNGENYGQLVGARAVFYVI